MAFIPLKPIPIKDRNSMIFIGMGRIDVKDNAFVVIDEVNGERMHIPVGSIVCIMLEPGTRVSHEAVKLASATGTLLIWVGEAGVRLYSVGQPGGARSDKLLYQAKLALDEELRLKVVRKMFELRFGEPAPQKRSVEQLRGIEGARVRKTYQILVFPVGTGINRSILSSPSPSKCVPRSYGDKPIARLTMTQTRHREIVFTKVTSRNIQL
ncbi:hypothetical protein XBI1_700010 [Xenorhabdus bovienii str. Intermedium]|uniref:CRISPR-associated endonuclease Cas1 n=1 Tax=Xenorhabdus bovienii str. Intermedium TaxID=1379677 RepID=A0A077QG07_XENBV|nr:hypothetical protein XBI1_700010 [Xenorhabdus bovienii str. Intermedium]